MRTGRETRSSGPTTGRNSMRKGGICCLNGRHTFAEAARDRRSFPLDDALRDRAAAAEMLRLSAFAEPSKRKSLKRPTNLATNLASELEVPAPQDGSMLFERSTNDLAIDRQVCLTKNWHLPIICGESTVVPFQGFALSPAARRKAPNRVVLLRCQHAG